MHVFSRSTCATFLSIRPGSVNVVWPLPDAIICLRRDFVAESSKLLHPVKSVHREI